MNLYHQQLQHQTRRHFLAGSGISLGSIALGQMLSENSMASGTPANPLAPKKPHFKGKPSVIYHPTGSPPHLDLWDYKPELVKRNNQTVLTSSIRVNALLSPAVDQS